MGGKSRRLFVRAAVSAMVLAAAPHAALAAAGSVITIETKGIPDGAPPVNLGKSSGAPAGQRNDIEVSKTLLPSGSRFFAAGTALEGGGRAEVRTISEVNTAQPDGSATFTASSKATVTLGDTLTLSGSPGDHRLVELHKTIDLEYFQHAVDAVDASPRGDDTDFDIVARTTTEFSGDGIGPGPLGASVFGLDEFHLTADGQSRNTLQMPTRVDFDLVFGLGDARDFDLTLSSTTSASSRSALEQMRLVNFVLAGFLSGGSLRDVATGAPVCGVTGSSASGFDYLAGIDIPACQGGGGGGATAAPEPALWAMMIMGFGASGAMLRRRRLAAA